MTQGLLLFAHGARDPRWALPFEDVASRVRQAQPGWKVELAYLQARGGGISLKVFGGIMLGISFVLLNNVAGHLGMLHNWTPWIVSSTPSLIYLLLSLAAFAWLVRYR